MCQQKNLSQEQKEVLFGCLLGDASLFFRNKKTLTVRVEFKQGLKNKEYLMHLYSLFADFCTPNYDIKSFSRSSEGVPRAKSSLYYHVRFYTRTLPQFFSFYLLFYPGGRKSISTDLLESPYLTPRALAYWFMDDGHCENKAGRYKISTQCFSLKEQQQLQEALKNRFDLNTVLYKKDNSFVLVIQRVSVAKFRDLVEPYMVPSMKYKLGNFRRDSNGKFIKNF